MRIIHKTLKQTTDHYSLISQYEKESYAKNDVEKGLSSIFLISQNFPVRSVSDFFSGENFSMTECYEEIQVSYHLIKCGFYKQSMISLRTSLEIGLLSIYWSILGTENTDFKQWLSSKFNTPYQNDNFWKVFKSNENIKSFDLEFNLIKDIKKTGLSDFVHTKGVLYSNFGEVQRKLHGQDEIKNYKEWIESFKEIVRILEILHLLRFPTLNVHFSTDYLLSKFGVFENIPLFGCGLGDEMEDLYSFIPENQLAFIKDKADLNDEVIEVKKRLYELPVLTQEEIEQKIIGNQKSNIKGCGFENWNANYKFYDTRITSEMICTLKEWAISENLMNIESIIEKHKKVNNELE